MDFSPGWALMYAVEKGEWLIKSAYGTSATLTSQEEGITND
jgi:hypothetical protein